LLHDRFAQHKDIVVCELHFQVDEQLFRVCEYL